MEVERGHTSSSLKDCAPTAAVSIRPSYCSIPEERGREPSRLSVAGAWSSDTRQRDSIHAGRAIMNVQEYRRRLLDLEGRLSQRIRRGEDDAGALAQHGPGEIGDASMAEEGQSEELSEAELDGTVLQQVRDALQRIDEGTFGRCVVDGAPIEEKRLEAVPWTPYCLKHQALGESAKPSSTL